MSTAGSALIEETRIGVRLKISSLWVVLLILYAYGDIFGFFKPGQIEDVVSGEISGIDITEGFLFAVSLYVGVATAMIFLTLVLRPASLDGRTPSWRSCTSPRSSRRRSESRRTTGSSASRRSRRSC